MAYLVAIGALILLAFLAVRFTMGGTTKRKCMVWGLFIMLGFNPFLSFLISIPVGVAEGDGFAAVAMMMLLIPSFFIIGFITFLVGVFKSGDTAANE
jgi:hypothetical protein